MHLIISEHSISERYCKISGANKTVSRTPFTGKNRTSGGLFYIISSTASILLLFSIRNIRTFTHLSVFYQNSTTSFAKSMTISVAFILLLVILSLSVCHEHMGHNDNMDEHLHVEAPGYVGKNVNHKGITKRTCGVHDKSPEESDHIDSNTKKLFAAKTSGVKLAATGGIIDVYFHVITSSSGDNAVTDQQIVDQMAVLNAAYEAGNWVFNLVLTNRVNSNAWKDLASGSNEEKNMKKTLRQGSCKDLNIYSSNALNGLLGWYHTFTFTMFQNSS